MKYQSSTKSSGIYRLFVMGVLSAGLTVFALIVPISTESLILSIFCLIPVFLPLGYFAVVSIRNNRKFICEITADEFRYESPVKESGDSFAVAIDDIIEVLEVDDADGFFIKTNSKEYWVSDHFGNPTYKFMQLLKSRIKGQQDVWR